MKITQVRLGRISTPLRVPVQNGTAHCEQR